MFNTRDIRHLRRCDKALRSLVAEHPWADLDTPVHHLLAEWRSSFPAATACRLESATLSKGQLMQLEGLSAFASVGFRSKAAANEQPLSSVRVMPRLEVLTMVERAVEPTTRRSTRGVAPLVLAPSAAVWGELGRLRELSLDMPADTLPINLLSSLNGAVLRKLSISVSDRVSWRRMGGWGRNAKDVVTDAALAALPLLEELCLIGVLGPAASALQVHLPLPQGLPSPGTFTGSGLASLPRLASLTLHGGDLPPDVFSQAPASLRALDVSNCSGLVDATFTTARLAGLTSLTLHDPPVGVTSEAFAGLAALESLVVKAAFHNTLISDATLAVLGSHGRLRRLVCSSAYLHSYSHAITQ